jgi:hypothetical protein
MSKYHHTAVETADNILHDFHHLTTDEFISRYGVEINEDGSVYDSTYNKSFPSLGDWVMFEAEQNEMACDCIDSHDRGKFYSEEY